MNKLLSTSEARSLTAAPTNACWRYGQFSGGGVYNDEYLKVAEYAGTLENYEKAIKIYEQVAAASLENNLLKYAAKEHFFRASLCHLCIDSLNAQHAVQKWGA